ncbi:hypothetical protein V1264_019312 [Littorina saxatilis]|uniref:Uncharacterized protein n=1 Tax=Littorina saxatilis TaxID=31220 RepID=A0AAN9BF27_9CAEN
MTRPGFEPTTSRSRGGRLTTRPTVPVRLSYYSSIAKLNAFVFRQFKWGGDVAQSVARWICIQLAAVSVSSSPRSARDLFLRVNFVCRLSSVSEHPRVYTQAQDQVRTEKIL